MYKNLIKLIENDLDEKESYRFSSFKNWIYGIEDIREIDDLEIIFQDLFMIKIIYSRCKGYYQVIREQDYYLIILSNKLDYDEVRIILIFILAMILLCPNDVTNEYHYQEIICESKILIVQAHRQVLKFVLEFLMPKSSVRYFVRVQASSNAISNEKLIEVIAKNYRVKTTIARKRLISLGLID